MSEGHSTAGSAVVWVAISVDPNPDRPTPPPALQTLLLVTQYLLRRQYQTLTDEWLGEKIIKELFSTGV